MRWLVCALLSVAACGSSSGGGAATGEVNSCSLDVEWGVGSGSGFVWLRDGGTAPMTTDADGTCFLDSTLRLSGTSDADAFIQTTVTVDGYEPVYQPLALVPFIVDADGASYAEVRLSLGDAAPSNLSGRTVMVVVQANTGACGSWTASRVVLAHDDP